MGYTAAILGVLALGTTIYTGEQQRIAGKKSLRRQDEAQKRAQGQALRQERESASAQRRVNAVKPDVSAFLAQQANGSPATALTGSAGIDPDRLNLSRITPLGL